MKTRYGRMILILLASFMINTTIAIPVFPSPDLPSDIEWITNTEDPVYSSSQAAPGGEFNIGILSFPMTFRTVGPDSNGSFRSAILDNQLALINIHPNTEKIIPELATHWAYGKDQKTMYFKLNPDARWSDGEPVTAGDFLYTLTFMRSKQIVAPWYNEYYTHEIDRIVKYDDHTIAVVAAKAGPDLHLKLGIQPTPEHYYGKLDKDFVRSYNWKIVPNTGPYIISGFKKGKYIAFERKKNWWAENLRYFKHRFNVDKVVYTVIRDYSLMWEHFKKRKIDVFPVTDPKYWYEKTKTDEFEKGYINRVWFFNDTQQSAQGLWMNQDFPVFADKRVRYAFAHGMNIEKVIHRVLRNDYFRLEHGFMGYGPYSNPDIRARRFDLNKVDHYMKSAGWNRGPGGIWRKGGMRFSVGVVYSNDEHTPRLVVLKQEARRAGIELRLQKMDPSATFKKILEKKHEAAWMGWSTSLRPQYWEHFHSVNAHKPQTNNITNTDDPEMDRLIESYRDSLDAEERIRLSRRIQEKIHEICPFAPTFMVPYARQAFWRWWRLPSPPGTRQSKDLFDPFNAAFGGLFWRDEELRTETVSAMKKGASFQPVVQIDSTYKMKTIRTTEQ